MLFIGGRIGYEALGTLLRLVKVSHVFLEREHAHESVRYSERIEALCEKAGVPLSDDLREDALLAACRAIRPDYLMCFGYRRMIRSAVLACAKIACVGSHFSPLPRYRGFAPLNWLLIHGEKQTAVNVFFLCDEVDAGDIIARSDIPISDEDDINTLTEKCVARCPGCWSTPWRRIGAPGKKQDHSLATYTCSRSPEDGLIDWKASSKDLRSGPRPHLPLAGRLYVLQRPQDLYLALPDRAGEALRGPGLRQGDRYRRAGVQGAHRRRERAGDGVLHRSP